MGGCPLPISGPAWSKYRSGIGPAIPADRLRTPAPHTSKLRDRRSNVKEPEVFKIRPGPEGRRAGSLLATGMFSAGVQADVRNLRSGMTAVDKADLGSARAQSRVKEFGCDSRKAGLSVISTMRTPCSVTGVLLVVRKPLSTSHPKVHGVVRADSTDFSATQDELKGLTPASIAWVSQRPEATRRSTPHHLQLHPRCHPRRTDYPDLTFTRVSGEGTDGTEKGRPCRGPVPFSSCRSSSFRRTRAQTYRPHHRRPSRSADGATPGPVPAPLCGTAAQRSPNQACTV